MKKINIPKEELYQKYIIENLPRKECAIFFNVTEKAIIRRLNEYGIKKDSKKIYENIRNGTFKKYGVNVSFHSKELQDKIQNTMLERYGVRYTAQSSDLRQKMSDTIFKKYGKSYYVETNSFKEKTSSTCNEKYGVDWPCQYKKCIEALEKVSGHSKPERDFSELLDKHNIKYEQEFPLRGFKYDFKIGNYLFEINPSGTHNVNFGVFGHEPKDKKYHFIKHVVAKEFGYHCVHIFDWDDSDKIVSLFLCKKEKIFARKCKIQEVPLKEAKEFLNSYHLQSYAKDSVRIGLYYKNELVEIMTFDKPRYNKNYDYEIVRLCSKKNVVGGAEKIFNYFIDKYNPQSVVSYCDLAKFDGQVYRNLGFVSINKPQPSKHWYNLKTHQHITDNLLRQKGFDQLFKTNYGKGTSNEELMLENGFVEIYDCGQLSYVWNYK